MKEKFFHWCCCWRFLPVMQEHKFLSLSNGISMQKKLAIASMNCCLKRRLMKAGICTAKNPTVRTARYLPHLNSQKMEATRVLVALQKVNSSENLNRYGIWNSNFLKVRLSLNKE